MSNIFNKTNSPYLIAGTLATLALLASEVFIAAPYFKFLAPVASLNVSFPLIIGCAVVSFAVLAFSCVMIASNIMKTESDDKVPILNSQANRTAEGNNPDSEPRLEEGNNPDSEPRLEEGTNPDSEPKADAQHDNQADGTAAVPDIFRDALSDTYSKSVKLTEEQHTKVFAFANFVFAGIALFAADALSGLIHSEVAVEGRGVALANDQYWHEYGSTQFEASKNSKGTDHYRIKVLLQAVKVSNEELFTNALKKGEKMGWDILPTSLSHNTRVDQHRELQVRS
ncbi:MAG TPA: hypothetical protein DEQ74_01155 [Wolbachia sp.]|nr:hypothetical protein [Wolbachia sp.]